MAKLQDKLYNRVIDGKLTVESGDEFGSDISVNISQLEAESTDEGKALVVQDDGSVSPEPMSGGTKLYKHTISGTINFEGDDFVTGGFIISTSSTQITNTEYANLCYSGVFNSSYVCSSLYYIDNGNLKRGIIIYPSFALDVSPNGVYSMLGGAGASITDTVTPI